MSDDDDLSGEFLSHPRPCRVGGQGCARDGEALRTALVKCRQKGVGVFSLLLIIFGIGASGLMVQDIATQLERMEREKAQKREETMREARQALVDYMLHRANDPVDLAQGASANITPRWLMLPCPDNIGDDNLDGAQDPGCSAKEAKGPLEGGSRFGRIPWRSEHQFKEGKVVDHVLNDGLEVDVRDVEGNRPWYALARNLAPDSTPTAPLNLHRLATKQDGWLTVRNQHGHVMSDKVAAVIIAPGRAHQPRLREEHLATMATINYNRDVKATSGMLNPKRYFEAFTIRTLDKETVKTVVVENYKNDGVFMHTYPEEGWQYNDQVVFVDLNDLLTDHRYFLRVHRNYIGVGEMQNAPRPGLPLAKITTALAAYHSLFGFYPTPAELEEAEHLNTRERHCARFTSGSKALTVTLPPGTRLFSTAPVTASVVTLSMTATITTGATVTTTLVTTTMAASAAFLLRDNVGVSLSDMSVTATIVDNDKSRATTDFTLARYARIDLPTDAVFQVTATNRHVFPAGVEVTFSETVTVKIESGTPLAPKGDLVGWLGEHDLPGARAGSDGQSLFLHGNTRAMFWGEAALTSSLTMTILRQGDALTLTAGSRLRLEQDYNHLSDMNVEIPSQDGVVATLSAVKPSGETFHQRQFVVWALADMERGSSTVQAPAVLYPWREKTGSKADSRDNLHAYPPCFDSRNFFGRRFKETIKDQPMVYAVAEECHYGGDPTKCGKSGGGGITVSVAEGAVVALPQAVTLTHSYTFTVGNYLTVALRDGVVRRISKSEGVRPYDFPVLEGVGTAQVTLASFRMSTGLTFTVGATVVIPAGTPLTGGAGTRIEDVPALLIYSPSPFLAVRCGDNPRAAFDQRQAAEDITDLCYWVDDQENADRDDEYVIYRKNEFIATGRNDYFMLLGGHLRLQLQV